MTGWIIWQFPIAYTIPFVVDLSGSFVFNWLDLSDCWELAIDTSNYDDINQIDLDTYQSPRIDWGGVLWYYVRGKNINIKMVIKKNTEAELNDMIDYLKLKLFKKEWLLKIMINGTYRQVKANLVSLDFNRDFESKTILSNVNLSFKCMENFADENATYWTETGVNTPTLALDINNTWMRTDYQLYMIFWSWITNTDTITIEKDWYTMTISQTITDWWILIIDWINKQVLYNWNAIDYDWPFVQLENWSNPILITINGTYTADITYLYFVNYL
jgi:hypothetical protein